MVFAALLACVALSILLPPGKTYADSFSTKTRFVARVIVAFRPGGGTSVLYVRAGLLKYVGASHDMELRYRVESTPYHCYVKGVVYKGK
jgi:2-phospho-L-lactate guanylyltransferase (CobY/MobA/RfbA family)